jgi:hypothetical protein
MSPRAAGRMGAQTGTSATDLAARRCRRQARTCLASAAHLATAANTPGWPSMGGESESIWPRHSSNPSLAAGHGQRHDGPTDAHMRHLASLWVIAAVHREAALLPCHRSARGRSKGRKSPASHHVCKSGGCHNRVVDVYVYRHERYNQGTWQAGESIHKQAARCRDPLRSRSVVQGSSSRP